MYCLTNVKLGLIIPPQLIIPVRKPNFWDEQFAIAPFYCQLGLQMLQFPIGSMYGIYGNIYHLYTPNVSIYTSTMDPMGFQGYLVTLSESDVYSSHAGSSCSPHPADAASFFAARLMFAVLSMISV